MISESVCKREGEGSILTKLCALALAFAPILDPYILGSIGSFTVRVMDVVLVSLALTLMVKRRLEGLKAVRSLIFLLSVLLFCTLISSFFPLHGRSTVSALALMVKYGLYTVCFGLLCGKAVLYFMMRYATAVAAVGAIYIILQSVLTGGLGISIWDGVLPFAINESDGFSMLFDRNTGEIRPHAFFQEPSYFAIYAAPVLMGSLKSKRWFTVSLLVVGMLLSTSFLGVVVLAVAVLVLVAKAVHGGKRINWAIAALAVSILAIIIIATAIVYFSGVSTQVSTIIDNAGSKINSIVNVFKENSWGKSSAQYRLLGNVELIWNYSPLEMVFGVGMGQYASIFANQIESGYSSTAVNILLNCGVIGLASLVAWLVAYWRRAAPGQAVFVLLFAIVLFVDNCWFSWYFFYLLSWVIAARYLDESERYESFCSVPETCPDRSFSRLRMHLNGGIAVKKGDARV